jgi:hypothetical protein
MNLNHAIQVTNVYFHWPPLLFIFRLLLDRFKLGTVDTALIRLVVEALSATLAVFLAS